MSRNEASVLIPFLGAAAAAGAVEAVEVDFVADVPLSFFSLVVDFSAAADSLLVEEVSVFFSSADALGDGADSTVAEAFSSGVAEGDSSGVGEGVSSWAKADVTKLKAATAIRDIISFI
jgi:hypothetical protein